MCLVCVRERGETKESWETTYTWFSPFGEKNHAAAHKATMITRPTKMLYPLAILYAAVSGCGGNNFEKMEN